MTGDKVPNVQSLDKPEDLKGLLRQDRGDDCLPCKVIGTNRHPLSPVKTNQVNGINKLAGSGAFLGLAAYSYFSGMSQLEKQRNVILKSKSMFGMRSRKFGIVGISAGLAWMGLWRALK